MTRVETSTRILVSGRDSSGFQVRVIGSFLATDAQLGPRNRLQPVRRDVFLAFETNSVGPAIDAIHCGAQAARGCRAAVQIYNCKFTLCGLLRHIQWIGNLTYPDRFARAPPRNRAPQMRFQLASNCCHIVIHDDVLLVNLTRMTPLLLAQFACHGIGAARALDSAA
jgi:hypothetical protein